MRSCRKSYHQPLTRRVDLKLNLKVDRLCATRELVNGHTVLLNELVNQIKLVAWADAGKTAVCVCAFLWVAGAGHEITRKENIGERQTKAPIISSVFSSSI